MEGTTISVEELQDLKSYTQFIVSIDELRDIYEYYSRPMANAVAFQNDVYLSFKGLPMVEFVIKDTSINHLTLIESFNKKIYATSNSKNLLEFIFLEFTQGKNLLQRVWRFLTTVFPLVIVNYVVFYHSSGQTVTNYFNALLAANSIFVAIFSLFTVSHEHMDRKKLMLFEKGKLSYLFSIDKNLAIVGLIAIMASLLGILIPLNDINSFCFVNFNSNLELLLAILLLNIATLFTFLLLRSIWEFYIHRPAKFIMGNLKKESLQQFD